eukprot:CAMPEP_0184329728 /NCGR_PEP_ID=MMETSP1049-20130417/144302_1 /TAXON_ID=77928 /ORGANISM="Proteomonas sulcata, Strain CCMP704" /LENGTH=278 /DNA_ID=CAMNT_0026652111 /DNA_START=304 /DNA_END=1140 /DNA_ORIENTATION=+
MSGLDHILVADSNNQRIRIIDVSQDGRGSNARFNNPSAVAFSPDGSFLLVADSGNHAIRRVNVSSGATSTLVGKVGNTGLGVSGFIDGIAPADGRLTDPQGIALNAAGTLAAISDTGNKAIRLYAFESQSLTTVAGRQSGGYLDGAATAALFSEPLGIAFMSGLDHILVADSNNQRIRIIDVSNSLVRSLSGNNSAFLFENKPMDVAIPTQGSWLLLIEGNCIKNFSLVPLPGPPPPPDYQQPQQLIAASRPAARREPWLPLLCVAAALVPIRTAVWT